MLISAGCDSAAQCCTRSQDITLKTRTLIAMSACGGTLIAPSTASAAFLGLQVVNVSSWMSTTGPANFRNSYNAAGGPEVYQIYRVFAAFDGTSAMNSNNRVNAVFGSSSSPWALMLATGTLVNWTEETTSTPPSTLHNDLAPISNSPSNLMHGWETWATIGTQNNLSDATYSPGAHNGQLNHFQGSFVANDAALFITSSDPQGNAIALNSTSAVGMGGFGFGVLLMQITVTPGSSLSMTFNLTTGAPGGIIQDIFSQTVIIWPEHQTFVEHLQRLRRQHEQTS
jgi:hypothetical protein